MIQVLKWYQVTGSLSVSSVSFSGKILYLEGRVALGSQSFVSVLLKKKSFPRPSLRVLGQSGAVHSEGSRPAASLRAPPPPTPLLIGEEMEGRNSAVAASVRRALFIGSCIYFDCKRQSDPNFKNRLREQRKKQKLSKERAALSKLPDLKDAEAVQKFFLKEIQLG